MCKDFCGSNSVRIVAYSPIVRKRWRLLFIRCVVVGDVSASHFEKTRVPLRQGHVCLLVETPVPHTRAFSQCLLKEQTGGYFGRKRWDGVPCFGGWGGGALQCVPSATVLKGTTFIESTFYNFLNFVLFSVCCCCHAVPLVSRPGLAFYSHRDDRSFLNVTSEPKMGENPCPLV